MSKAKKRRRTAGRKRKLDTLREPNGRELRGESRGRLQARIEAARERKAAITGRGDLPDDVLGILFGHRRIGDDEYNIGRKYQALGERIYGSAAGAGSAMFKETISPPNAEDAERSLEPMSDERAQDIFMDMDHTLRRCGLVIHNVTVAAIRYNRYPQSEQQVAWVVQGLEALAIGHAPKKEHRRMVANRAA